MIIDKGMDMEDEERSLIDVNYFLKNKQTNKQIHGVGNI
jgi:hypothetical protein